MLRITVPDESGDTVHEFDLATQGDSAAGLLATLLGEGRAPLAQPSGKRVESLDDLPADTEEIHALAPYVGG